MPANTVLLLVGVVAVLGGIIRPLMAPNRCSRVGFWMAGGGTVLTVLALFLLAGLNDTAFYPSTTDLQSSLTIRNASSSHYTLTAMSYVSLMVPFVLAYIVWSWRVINRKPLTEKELNSTNNHIY
jgi:cytochrome d ubiquinol oxidase subunit II